MQLLQPSHEQAEAGLRAMRMLATTRQNDLSPAARNLLGAAQKHVLHTDFDIETLPPITPEALAKVFDNPALAHQFVQGMTVVSLADGPPTGAQGRVMAGRESGRAARRERECKAV